MSLSFAKFIPKPKEKRKKQPVLFVELSGDLHAKFKALAEKHTTTMSRLTIALILSALDEDSNSKADPERATVPNG